MIEREAVADLFVETGRVVIVPGDALAPPVSDDLEAVPVKPKKSKTDSPTKRSLRHLRDQGYIAQVVEHWNSFARVRNDLFGFIDIVALSPDGHTVGVQATSLANVAARVRKITEEFPRELAALRRCGWTLVVYGWGKQPNGRYRLREVDLS